MPFDATEFAARLLRWCLFWASPCRTKNLRCVSSSAQEVTLPPNPRPRAYPIQIVNPQRRNRPSLEPKLGSPCSHTSNAPLHISLLHVHLRIRRAFDMHPGLPRLKISLAFAHSPSLSSPRLPASSSFPPGTIPLPCARTDPSPISSFRRTLWSYHMLDERPQRVRLCHTTSGTAMSGEISCPLNLLARSSSKLGGSSIQKLVTRIPL